jgi:hypothetical protein
MKPANFPERKNQRRISALNRLLAKDKASAYEIGVLRSRILESARHIRTKKNHSSRSIGTS